jgi:hypothetical protein
MVQKNIRFALIAMIALIYLLGSCNGGVSENQLPGVYVSNFEDYSDTIHLNVNHTYIYKMLSRNSTAFGKGKWAFKDSRITLENFGLSTSKKTINGIWIAEVKIVNNQIRIIYADEEGYYYRKLK